MRKFYALTLDGEIVYLGKYKAIEDVMEEYNDNVWYFDEQSAIDMVTDLMNTLKETKDI